jgi:1,4-dihydroxy-2-naphthoate octaprenyltransferase
MKKFFYNVLLLIFGGFSLMCLWLLFNNPFEWKNLFSTIIFLFFTFVFAFLSDEAELRENNTPKEDEPKEDEIISVTEIKGERNIIIDVVVKIIVFIIGLVLTGFLTNLCGGIIGLLPLIFAIMYCFKTNDKNKD